MYLPLSIELIVCLETPRIPASSACERLRSILRSLTLFLICVKLACHSALVKVT